MPAMVSTINIIRIDEVKYVYFNGNKEEYCCMEQLRNR